MQEVVRPADAEYVIRIVGDRKPSRRRSRRLLDAPAAPEPAGGKTFHADVPNGSIAPYLNQYDPLRAGVQFKLYSAALLLQHVDVWLPEATWDEAVIDDLMSYVELTDGGSLCFQHMCASCSRLCGARPACAACGPPTDRCTACAQCTLL